jgi:CheY-like chemotaxis protein
MASRCSMQFEQRADVLQASDTAEGLRLAEAHPDLDVAFLDLNIPDQNGMDVIPVFAKRCPRLPAQSGLLGRTIRSPPWESRSGAAVNLQEPQGGQQE